MLVDGHVHLRPAFKIENFLDASDRNFRLARSALGDKSSSPGVLLLAESKGESALMRCHEFASGEQLSDWQFENTLEELSIVAYREGRPRLVFIAGSQIVTAENLEVLALVCDSEIPSGASIDETLTAVRNVGAIAVIPWGFGKWTLTRRKVMERLIERESGESLCLGDNAGRLQWGRYPMLFKRAKAKGALIIPGSDPLPLRGHESRAGSYGFVVEAEVDWRRPAADLRQILRSRQFEIRPYGRRDSLWPFFRNQVSIHLRKIGRGMA